ncbi:MAG: M24 family metallopeptidase [Candidatus Bipolaricaulia bacterium]
MDYRDRVDAFTQRLEEREIDVVLLFDTANLRYFTGFRLNRAAHAILMIGRDGRIYFIVARLDYERARRDCWIHNKNIRHFLEDTPEPLSVLRDLLGSFKPRSIGIEVETITCHQAEYLKALSRSVTSVVPHMEAIDADLLRMRAIKSEAEIEVIRKAAAIADRVMQVALQRAKPGVTEAEISSYVQYLMVKEGAEGPSFEPFLMSGENAWLPQRVSTEKPLAAGELVLFDMGTIYQGYCSDITRTFSLGGLSNEQSKLFRVAYQAQQAAIEAVRPGVTGGEVDRVARAVIAAEGLGDHFPHLTGHGLGLAIHEMPILDVGRETVLEPNMVVTVEPGIYLAGVGAARVEDMVLVTEDGHEVLTKTERELI